MSKLQLANPASKPSSVCRCVAYERRRECRSSPGGKPSFVESATSLRRRAELSSILPAPVGNRGVGAVSAVAGEADAGPVIEHVNGPVEHGEDGALFRWDPFLDLPCRTRSTPTRRARAADISGKVGRDQVACFTESQAPAVHRLHHDRVTPGRESAFASGVQNPLRFEVSEVKELLQLTVGERPFLAVRGPHPCGSRCCTRSPPARRRCRKAARSVRSSRTPARWRTRGTS